MEEEVQDSASGSDALLELGDRIAELARSIQVAEWEMMRLLVDFDRRRGWMTQGFGSCAEWLAWRVGIGRNAARERVRTAHALATLPRTSAAMAAGTLSYAKVRSLTRVATPASEDALLEFALAGSAAHLERVVRAWKAMDDRRELSLDRLRHRNRCFSVWVEDDGSWGVKGRLDPEVGALLMRAVEAAGDALYHGNGPGAEGARGAAAGVGDELTGPTPAQRRADAVGLVAERALSAGFGGEGKGAGRADRYQVLLLVEADTLHEGRPSGRSELEGSRVPAETARRLTCDAGVAFVVAAGAGPEGPARPGGGPRCAPASEGHRHRVTAVTPGAERTGWAAVAGSPTPLAVGRRTRTVPPALRRALQVRDRGCRFPGCGSRYTEAHHVVHWADGGRTDLRNLVLLCRRHHRAVHEGAMRVCLDREANVVFFTPSGRAVLDAPEGRRGQGQAPPPSRPPPAPPSPAPWPGADRYRHERDVPWGLEARVGDVL